MSNDRKAHLPTYSKQEVASILTRALDSQLDGGRVSHDELLETAREIGVTTLEIEAAVAEEVRVRAERVVLEEAQKKAARTFLRHLATFVGTSAALVALDLLLTHGVWWYFVVLGWGLGVAVHAAFTFLPRREPPPRLPAAAPEARIEVRRGRMEMHGADEEHTDIRRRVRR